jgi:hypothetical protein
MGPISATRIAVTANFTHGHPAQSWRGAVSALMATTSGDSFRTTLSALEKASKQAIAVLERDRAVLLPFRLKLDGKPLTQGVALRKQFRGVTQALNRQNDVLSRLWDARAEFNFAEQKLRSLGARHIFQSSRFAALRKGDEAQKPALSAHSLI